MDFFGTYLLSRLDPETPAVWEKYVFYLDLVALIFLLYIALNSRQFWPIPIVSLQLLTVGTPFAHYLNPYIQSAALVQLQGVWGYIQLVILAAAADLYRRDYASMPHYKRK